MPVLGSLYHQHITAPSLAQCRWTGATFGRVDLLDLPAALAQVCRPALYR